MSSFAREVWEALSLEVGKRENTRGSWLGRCVCVRELLENKRSADAPLVGRLATDS
jgi:hypothetical protein